jgi:N-acyl-L-homoserine lactone synthetase
MRYIAFDLLDQHRHGSAFREYLRIRKEFFVDALGWNIPHNAEVEMDQYDNPCAHYVLVLEEGAVVAGARVMPTTAAWGPHRYMLRDARRGIIQIPATAVPEEIVSDRVWECTRLVISGAVTGQADRACCLSQLLHGTAEVVRAQGGDELISLSPAAMERTLRQLGFPAERISEPYREVDGRLYAMLRMPLLMPALAIAAE